MKSDVPFMIASGLFRNTERSMPRDSCSVCDSVPRFVGISVATTTFSVRIIANMAKVRVDRVTWEDMSDGDICPTPFSPLMFMSMRLRLRIMIGRLRATNMTEPTIISIIPITRISMGIPLTPVIQSFMATTNRIAGIM